MNRHRCLQRFLRYVQIDTTARADADAIPVRPASSNWGGCWSTSFGPWDRRRPAGPARHRAGHDPGDRSLACRPDHRLVRHLDTSPETTGAGVKPQVIENYRGGDLVVARRPGRVIRVADNPELDALSRPHADHHRRHDAAGGRRQGGRGRHHGNGRLARRAPRDPRTARCGSASPATRRSAAASTTSTWARSARRPATRSTATAADMIDVETFSADLAVVTVRGVNIHPSIAKGRMTNAVRAAADFIARLPRDRLSPETTDGREGFLHPYEISGGVGEVKLKILLRDFEAPKLAELADRAPAGGRARSTKEFPGGEDRRADRPPVSQHGRGACPRAAGRGLRPAGAWRGSGRTAKLTIVRGGTDGSRLTELGLPTPNLSCGAHLRIRRWNGPAWRRWSSRSSGWSRFPRFGERTVASNDTGIIPLLGGISPFGAVTYGQPFCRRSSLALVGLDQVFLLVPGRGAPCPRLLVLFFVVHPLVCSSGPAAPRRVPG